MTFVPELLRVDALPVLQNRVYASASEARASPRGNMVLVQDPASSLVFNKAFDPALLSYDADYQNEQAHSSVFRLHLDNVLSIIQRHFHAPVLIEVGCGKGHFLSRLRAAGYEATGIDPAYEGDSPHVVKASFTRALGLSSEAIVLRHVLEHIRNPVDFLRDIAAANQERGLIYIEVPCFEWICAQRAWFDIFYEHVNYFRLTDFTRMFGRVLESGHVFGGQYLYVIADLSTLREPPASETEPVSLPDDFLAGIERSRQRARAHSGRMAIWGASSKGVIFAHHMRQAGVDFDLAIDINPAKQGRYMAGTGLRIASPKDALQTLPPESLVFVMNSNYFDEIVGQSRRQFRLVKVDQNEF